MSDQPITSSLNHFSIFAFSDDYWRLTGDDRTRMLSEWSQGLEDAADAVHFYQTYPLECIGDLIVWSAAPISTPEAPAAFFDALARATHPHRRYIRLRDVLWGLTRPSQYSKARSAQEIDPFRRDRHPYLIMYPFTKTADWYLQNQEARQGMMNEHIRIGKQYRDITQLLLYSFGLQDQEFVVVYETDDLTRFSRLVMELAGAGSVAVTTFHPIRPN
jgi:chlorite dismutase